MKLDTFISTEMWEKTYTKGFEIFINFVYKLTPKNASATICIYQEKNTPGLISKLTKNRIKYFYSLTKQRMCAVACNRQIMITLDQETIEDLEVIKHLYQGNRSKALRGLVSKFKEEKPEIYQAMKAVKELQSVA